MNNSMQTKPAYYRNEDYEPEVDGLVNFKNYFMYADMVRNKSIRKVIYVPEDLTINNIDDHIIAIDNIFKDGIESEFVHNCKITIKWENCQCDISIVDYWLNLFMWAMILKTGNKIRPKHIFIGSKANIITGSDNALFPWELKRKDIQKYINTYILTLDNKINIGNVKLNQIIADALWYFSYLEHFAYYLANTINNEDDIDLMRALPEFNEAMHTSLSNIPIEQVKDEGMRVAYKIIDIIKDSERYIGYEHGLTNSFRANEAINPRQFKEVAINIGTKPNGQGGIYPNIINKNFKTGGVNDPTSYFIESSCARSAQILSKINVGDSGEFARLLGLNNTDTVFNIDPNYECMSQHFVKYEIKSKIHLNMIKGRYFRYTPRGMDYLVNHEDLSMVGKSIYLHSPMTCASNSAGHGICRKCYGTLYWTNYNINIGKIAAEIISAQLTQRLLSAKHLLETMISTIKWNAEFRDFFDVDINSIKLTDDILEDDNVHKYIMVIDPDDVQLVSDEEESISVSDEYDDEDSGGESIDNDDVGIYNEYITSFIIITPDGKHITFGAEDQQELYLSTEFNNIIRKKAYANEGKIHIPLDKLDDCILFYIKINNNEISKAMNDIKNVINKAAVTENLTKDEALQQLVDLIVTGDLEIDSIHLEVILSNQIVDPKNILAKPNWNNPNVQYRMFTLNQALTNNPSIIISMLYKDLHRVLYNPLSFNKNAPSFFDLFFCEQPQVYMSDELLTEDTSDIRDLQNRVQMYSLTNKPTKEAEMMAKLEEFMRNDPELCKDIPTVEDVTDVEDK